MRLVIFGPGGFGREILRPAQQQYLFDARADVVFCADSPDSESVLGVPLISPAELRDDDEIVIAIGSPEKRRMIAERLAHVRTGNVIASTAQIGPGSAIGEGAVFCDFTMVTASATIGRHFHCNIYSYVAHDCVIGDFVTFAPRVCCNGHVRVEDGAYIGTGAVIRDGTDSPIVIGEGAVVGMGAVVTKSVPPGTIVVGNPARARQLAQS